MSRPSVWEFNNMTPYKASALVVHDHDGAEMLLVVVKGTFTFNQDGVLARSATQIEPTVVPRFTGDPLSSCLLSDTDFVPFKLTTDVILLGSAHAQGGRPVQELLARLNVGGIDKKLLIRGDRSVGQSESSAGTPFTSMPITYERAEGGVRIAGGQIAFHLQGDARNPAGTGFRDRGGTIGSMWPNVYHANAVLDKDAPAGFGPIPRHWLARRRYAGTYDDNWKMQLSPRLPKDFDSRFYQCAPTDQQSKQYLLGGEPVDLTNLTPQGRTTFRLPKVGLSVFATIDGTTHDAQPVLHTVVLSPDQSTVTMVWHCEFGCPRLEEAISDISVIQHSTAND